MIKNFFNNLNVTFHDLDSFIRNDVHVSRRIKIGLLIFITVLSVLYVADYLYLRSYEKSYDSITVLVNNGEYRIAYERLLDILEDNPDDPFFLVLAARANIGLAEEVLDARMKRLFLSKSLDFLSKAEDINPNIVEIYSVRGLTYFYLGNFSLSELAYKKAFTINGEYAKGLVGLGNAYLMQGNILLAEESFSKALKLEPSNEFALIGLIDILSLQQRFDRVINVGTSLYVTSTDRSVKVKLAHLLGVAYLKSANTTRALQYFEEGLLLDPESVPLNYMIAELSFYKDFDINNPTASLVNINEMISKVIMLNPDYPYSYALLTRIASITSNRVDYDKYLQLTKDKLSQSFLTKSEKDIFLKTLPLFNKSSGNVKIKVISTKSTQGWDPSVNGITIK